MTQASLPLVSTSYPSHLMKPLKKQGMNGPMESWPCGSDTASVCPFMTTQGRNGIGGSLRSGKMKQYQLCQIHTELRKGTGQLPGHLALGASTGWLLRKMAGSHHSACSVAGTKDQDLRESCETNSSGDTCLNKEKKEKREGRREEEGRQTRFRMF